MTCLRRQEFPRCAATVKVRNLPIFLPFRQLADRHPSSEGMKGVFVVRDLEVELLANSWAIDSSPEQLRFKRDFDSSLFTEETPFAEIAHKVSTYMGEKLFMPGYQEIQIGFDGSLDPEYTALMQKSIDYWRAQGDYETVHRFEMELVGMKRLAIQVSMQIERDRNSSARHIIGSDPGSTYGTEEGAKSVVFVGEVKRLTENGIVYGQYAIPIELLELLSLYEKMTKISVVELTDITAEELVAYAAPLIGTLNEVADIFGQGNWDQIVEKATNQLRLDKDQYGVERRQELIRYYSNLIHSALHEGRDREYLNIIDESMRRVFALEAGASELLGLRKDRVKEIVERNLIDVKAEKMGLFTRQLSREQITWFEEYYQVSLSEVMEYRGWMTNVFQTNPLARRALVTGCGGGVNIDLNSNPWGGIESWAGGYSYDAPTEVGFEMMSEFGYQETTTSSSAESLEDGDTACYRCPVCESEGHNPGGEVKRKGSYLVCQDKPDQHYIEYNSSG